MSMFKDFKRKITEDILKAFRDTDSTSRDKAKPLNTMGIDIKNNGEHKVGLTYLKSNGYIKKYKKLYFLDENALSNPVKNYFRRIGRGFLIVFPVFLIITLLLIFLAESSK